MTLQTKRVPPSDPLLIENLQLRAHLQDLLEQARNNQNILYRHHQLNLKLISANGLVELLESIFNDLRDSSALDVVTLLALDSDYELQRAMTNLNIDPSAVPNLLLYSGGKRIDNQYLGIKKPVLGPYSAKKHSIMFPANLPTPASVAIVPLYRQHKLIGFLNFGSRNPKRFTGNVATDFVEEQASIVAICLENVINSEQLKHIGLTDPLTGVNNRRYLETRLHEEISRAQRQSYALSCMYIDIDHFKKINDTLGHQGGDEVLCEVAARIKDALRLPDALGRFGGEEFVVLLIDTNAEGALHVAERIRTSISDRPFALGAGKTCKTTVSIGIATLSTQNLRQPTEAIAQQLIAQADAGLHRAKNGGRNQVVYID